MMLAYLLLVLTFVGSVIPHHYASSDDDYSWSSESCEYDSEESEEQQCGENEHLDSCPPLCPVETCIRRPCDPVPDFPCTPGCRCNPGYLRDDNGKCIPESQCNTDAIGPVPLAASPAKKVADGEPRAPTTGKPPARKACPPRCRPTCSRPNPQNCRKNPACNQCPDGSIYVDRRNTTCIPVYQCPPKAGCNGDKNAVIRNFLIGCPSTCKKPDQGSCNKPDLRLGCICKSGYILNRKKNGKCIPINKCPAGTPCGPNETFVSCTQCIFDGCPTGGPRYPCDPTFPCPAGCVCASGYKRLNGQCILAENCPPVPDTDPFL